MILKLRQTFLNVARVRYYLSYLKRVFIVASSYSMLLLFLCHEYIFTYFTFYSENSFNSLYALVYPCLAINKDLCWLKLCRLIAPTRNSHKILLLKKKKFLLLFAWGSQLFTEDLLWQILFEITLIICGELCSSCFWVTHLN